MVLQSLQKIPEGKYGSFFTKLIDIIVPQNQDSSNFNDIFLVLEKEQMSLDYFFRNKSNKNFGEKHLKLVLYNLLCSMNFVHSANIVHRDLKPANILINKYCQIKLCDFGQARSLPKEKKSRVRRMSAHVTSRWYRAPEVICLD